MLHKECFTDIQGVVLKGFLPMVGPDGVENVAQFKVEALHMVPDPQPLVANTGDNGNRTELLQNPAPPLSITITG